MSIFCWHRQINIMLTSSFFMGRPSIQPMRWWMIAVSHMRNTRGIVKPLPTAELSAQTLSIIILKYFDHTWILLVIGHFKLQVPETKTGRCLCFLQNTSFNSDTEFSWALNLLLVVNKQQILQFVVQYNLKSLNEFVLNHHHSVIFKHLWDSLDAVVWRAIANLGHEFKDLIILLL